jgi:formamidopyrimidine-DNA glycosylase
MPELPEVEYTARQLRATVVGATIREVEVFWEPTIGYPDLPDFLAEVAGRRIEGIRRRGKFLLIDLSGDLFLSIHRRMTGNLLLLPPGWKIDTSLRETDPITWSTKGPTFLNPFHAEASFVDTQSSEHVLPAQSLVGYCRVCFNLVDGRRLLFTDPRKFGRIELWPRSRQEEAFARLGLEPLSEEFTVGRLATALASRKSSIKQVLLAQEVVAGVGNIYADEALFYAGIHPLRRADSLTLSEIGLLHEGIITVLRRGIEHGGTSFNDYRDLWGEAGENYNHVRVYQRTGEPCIRCGTSIVRTVIAQRSTHFCPTCQRLLVESIVE